MMSIPQTCLADFWKQIRRQRLVEKSSTSTKAHAKEAPPHQQGIVEGERPLEVLNLVAGPHGVVVEVVAAHPIAFCEQLESNTASHSWVGQSFATSTAPLLTAFPCLLP